MPTQPTSFTLLLPLLAALTSYSEPAETTTTDDGPEELASLGGYSHDLDSTDLPDGALQAIDFDEQGNLYVVNAADDENWCISAPVEQRRHSPTRSM